MLPHHSAPTYRARKTLECLGWPAKSPDISPINFSVCVILKAKILATSYQHLDGLKAELIEELTNVPDEILRTAVNDHPKYLRACTKGKGGYFEI